MITLLRDQPMIEQNLMLLDGGSGEEVGRIDIAIRLDPTSISAVVEEDVRKIEQQYFDPFVQDSDEIRRKLKKTEAICDAKQLELEETVRKVETLRTAQKSVEVELAKLKETRSKIKVRIFNNLGRE